MIFRSLALLVASLVSINLFALPANLVPAMVNLDRQYIPALGLSGQPDQLAKAKTAFLGFESTWNSFRSGIASQPGFDGEWGADLAKIDQVVQKAKAALIGDSNGPKAHEELEAVRMTLLDARQRQKVPYFVDYLTLYHNSMEDLINGKPAKPLKDWSATEKLGFAADLDISIARWNKLRAMEGLLPDYALAAAAQGTYTAQWQTIASIMSGIKIASEAGDDKAFAEKFGQLKPNFIKTFFLFGDFPR
ncbi:MAG: hypothetical protein WCL50_19365 [Spirochaetota bacterium]